MKAPGRLFWKLFLASVVLTALVMAVCAWLIARQTDAFIHDALVQHLLGQAHLLSEMAGDQFEAPHAADLDALSKRIAKRYPQPIRITFVLADGRVVGDSQADPAEMESHAGRPEVVAALRDGWGEDIHVSHTLSVPMQYVAARVGSAESPVGVVRVAMSTEAIGERSKVIRNLVWRIFLVGAAALLLFALGLAHLWSRPIQQMTATARSLSRGDLSARVKVAGDDEVADLGRSLNEMRYHLARQLETIDRQRRILESLLAQLLEGVVVVGTHGRIILINPAAVRLMGLAENENRSAADFEQADVQQFISDPLLRDMLLGSQATVSASGPPAAPGQPGPVREARIRVQTARGEMALLARSCDVRLPHVGEGQGDDDPGAKSSSARMVVLTDVSELSRAMQVRTDFVANASHELRTPLSAILGAVETLMSMDLEEDGKSARQFLQMIHRHADRMQAMVADLLDLSRLESSAEQYRAQPLSVRQQISELQSRHLEAIKSRDLQWQVAVEEGTQTVSANPHLLRLALDNLVDNAIKFTEPGGTVRVTCGQSVDQATARRMVVMEVSDSGCGIPDDQQSRVFERFYQVEAARSGPLRGTGLGLSIVRHAVAAMGGRVKLQSKLGQGTTVRLELPQ